MDRRPCEAALIRILGKDISYEKMRATYDWSHMYFNQFQRTAKPPYWSIEVVEYKTMFGGSI